MNGGEYVSLEPRSWRFGPFSLRMTEETYGYLQNGQLLSSAETVGRES